MQVKLLVGTKETQGRRKNDFCHVPEGEIVHLPFTVCDNERVDGKCGCRRSLVGMQSGTATTTVKVAMCEIEGDRMAVEGFEEMIFTALCRVGFSEEFMSDQEARRQAHDEAVSLLKAIAPFPVGTLVEYRGGSLVQRYPDFPPMQIGDRICVTGARVIEGIIEDIRYVQGRKTVILRVPGQEKPLAIPIDKPDGLTIEVLEHTQG